LHLDIWKKPTDEWGKKRIPVSDCPREFSEYGKVGEERRGKELGDMC